MSVSTPIVVPIGNENKSRIAVTIARVRPQDLPLISPIPATTDRLISASSTITDILKAKSAPVSASSTAAGIANTAMARIPTANIDATINLQITIAISNSGLFNFAPTLPK
jgi:hypothetical protein